MSGINRHYPEMFDTGSEGASGNTLDVAGPDLDDEIEFALSDVLAEARRLCTGTVNASLIDAMERYDQLEDMRQVRDDIETCSQAALTPADDTLEDRLGGLLADGDRLDGLQGTHGPQEDR